MDPNTPLQPQPQTPPPSPTPGSSAGYPQQQYPPYPTTPQQPIQQGSPLPSPQSYPQAQQSGTWSGQQSGGASYPPQSPQLQDMAQTPPPRPKIYGQTPLPIRILDWLKTRWYVPIGTILALVVIGNIAWQVLYPINALPPGLVVDGVNMGGVDREKAVTQLNTAYSKLKVKLFFGDATVPYKTPEAKELGIEVDNSARLESASYPYGLRFVPTSYWWAKNLTSVGEPIYNYDKTALDVYALKNLGEDCVIAPKNASLKLDDNRFAVVPAEAGGKCNMTEFKDAVGKTTYASGFSVKTGIKKIDAPLTDDIAKQLGDELNNNLDKDLPLQAGGETRSVKSSVVKGWLSFKPFIPEDKNDGAPLPPPRLLYVIESDRVRRYLESSGIAEKVEDKPGVTKVSTTDFTETSRTNGTPGVLIDITKTVASIDPFVNARTGSAKVIVGQVPPTTQFTRKYTPTDAGYRSLIEQFAQDNAGKIGIVLKELSGKKPWYSGAVNENMQLPAAGIEGIYLAYAAQKGIEDGSIQPTDRVYGNLSVQDCMRVAITDQDGDCIAALLGKMGNAKVHARMAEAGLNSTKFDGAVTVTTANDMATFMHKLARSELPITSKSLLESPLTDISLRSGMKSAILGGGKVAGGASEKSYNEVAVGTKNGQFVLSFISEGSDGAKTAAKLVKAVETLRQQKQDLKN